MSETCPICASPVSAHDAACPSCGFKLLGSTQKFKPIALDEEPAVAAVPAPVQASAELRVVRGPQTGVAFVLGADTLSIGRSPQCDIFLNDMTVSRQHADIVRTDAGYTICDSHSFNGVWVNDESVERAALHSGDVIQIGTFSLVYQQD